MPMKYDPVTHSIEMACGDTGVIPIEIDWGILYKTDVLLFAIFDRSSGEDLLCKAVEIGDKSVSIRLCNHDTRDIEPGKYRWNLRIVTDPERDEQGNIRAYDCGDNVVTVFDTPPTFRLTRGGAYV